MKTFILSLSVLFVLFTSQVHASNGPKLKEADADTIQLQTENNSAYYQKTVKVDSNIKVSTIYLRALQFMAAKNFQQTYGYAQEGKLIFTSTQDLNVTPSYDDDNEDPEPYTVQFSIIIDMKNGRYRYTINNITFYLPTQNGNRRMSLYDIYQKENPNQPKRVIKEARNIIASFERYIFGLTTELNIEIQHKALIYNSKF